MNEGKIWWTQVGAGLRLINKVSNMLRDGQSGVLWIPDGLPWRQCFYDEVDVRRSVFDGERRLRRLPHVEGTEPGRLVLERLCSPSVQMDYWPGESYGTYLGGRDDLTLDDYYVWITGVHTGQAFSAWMKLIKDYRAAAKNRERQAIFLVEYDGGRPEEGLPILTYQVAGADCRVFCLEAATELNNTKLQAYQVELALDIGGGDPELCGVLLRQGQALLDEPVECTLRALASSKNSEGGQFRPRSEQQIASAAWEATIVLLFPVLERYRMRFVEKHQNELKNYLPVQNSNGERVTDPFDLEIGTLFFILRQSSYDFDPHDMEKIVLCRSVRNLLAHNKLVACGDVEQVLALRKDK